MSGNKNQVTIEGNLVRDPVMITTPNGATVCNFSIDSNRFYKKGDEFEKEVSYFDVQCWQDLADYANNNCHKGTPVEIKGRLKQDRWVNREGVNQSKVIIVAESVDIRQRQSYQDKGNFYQPAQREECPF